MYNNIKRLLFIISLSFSILGQDIDPHEILLQTINRLNNVDFSFNINMRVQKIDENLIESKLKFLSYWETSDTIKYNYNYIKFNEPVDLQGVEIWVLRNQDNFRISRRTPITDKIQDITENTNHIEVMNFFDYIQLLKDFRTGNLSIKKGNLNKKEVHVIKSKSGSKKDKKKSMILYIDTQNFVIYRIEWHDKKGRTIKTLEFNKIKVIDNIELSTEIIFENLKDHSKITCNINKIKLNQFNQKMIDRVKRGLQ